MATSKGFKPAKEVHPSRLKIQVAMNDEANPPVRIPESEDDAVRMVEEDMDDDEELDETRSEPKRSAEHDPQSSSDDESNEIESGQRSQRQMQIPYKFRRDGVQDGRNRVPLFLQKRRRTENARHSANSKTVSMTTCR